MSPLRSSSRLALSGALLLSMAACGGGESGTDPDPGGDNRSPTAQISLDPAQVPEGDANQTVVTLDGRASSDPDGDPLTFNWNVANATFVEGSTTTGLARVTFPGTAPYPVTLTVSDGRGGSDQAQATVGLGAPANQPPVAMISADPTTVPRDDGNQTVVTLDGSGSSDPEGGAITFSWDVPSGRFENGTTSTSEVAQVTFPGSGDYIVTLTVTDESGATDEAQVVIRLGSE